MQREVLSVRNLSLDIRGKEILKNIHFSLEENEILCVLGKNGSSKSTLLKAILGLMESRGEILIFGRSHLSAVELAKLCAFVPQSSHIIFPFTLFEVVLMGSFAKSSLFDYSQELKQKAMQNLEKLGISEFANQKFSKLSGGQKQLGLIARALCQNAKILFLDEPTSALDISRSHKLLKLLKDLRQTIVFTSHRLEECQVADKLLMLKNGEVFDFGDCEKLLKQDKINALYGIKAQEIILPNGVKHFYMDS